LCQIRVLLQQLEARIASGDAVVLMGDFNESPECSVRKLLNEERPELTDPWLELGHDEEPSHHHFYEKIDYGSRVDWILANKQLEAQEILLDKSQSHSGIFPSDHYILKARFRWNKPTM
jgi:endonuclease/exonuclease/phosphatase family metal-dependent hydrolase